MSNELSVFNDVIGPVMRGPSSSHTAASWRIARVCLDVLNAPLKTATVDFDKDGAWASNYREQGTVMGINGGVLGLDIIDDRMKHTETLATERDIVISYQVSSFPTKHTNTVRLRLEGKSGKKVQVLAASLGGGAFEIQQIGNFPLSIRGNYYELLIWHKNPQFIPDDVKTIVSQKAWVSQSIDKTNALLIIKSPTTFSSETINRLKKIIVFDEYVVLKPILPIISGNEKELPFHSIESLLKYADKHQLNLGEMGLIYESCRSGFSKQALVSKMENIIELIDDSITKGLNGTTYQDRILQQQSHLIENAERAGKILNNALLNKTITYVTAIMEAKSAMEVIVANPTAGSCGTIGGVLKAVAENLNASHEDLVNAYFAAGIIGIYIAKGPGFSAEEHGCQVECGAASAMAAAGIVQLMGGTAKDAVSAASMAMQNMIGLVCDPVADRVEVPCLGKNINAATNALSSATMACSGFDAVIPLEEVIETVFRVGNLMPTCLKCTGRGGLAVTATSVKIKAQLK